MEKPKQIKLGAHTYKINWRKTQKTNYFGYFCADNNEITIYQREEQVDKDTLVHELLHLLFFEKFKIVDKMDTKSAGKEEALIRLVSSSILELFQNNQHLTEFLFHGLPKEDNTKDSRKGK